MAHDHSSGILRKYRLLLLVLRDPRLSAAEHRCFGAILDACYGDKDSCFLGPTRLAQLASCNEKTAREAIKHLVALGYLRVEPRNQRSNYLFPNFDLVGDISEERAPAPAKAGPQTRYGGNGSGTTAGAHARDSGSTRPEQRVSTPAESVLESGVESSRAGAGAQARPRARDLLASPESPLERELAYIRQQHSYGAYGDGEAADRERDRLVAEVRARFPLPHRASPGGNQAQQEAPCTTNRHSTRAWSR